MVSGFSAGIEDEIVLDDISSGECVVDVNSRARSVKEDVPTDCREATLRLVIHRHYPIRSRELCRQEAERRHLKDHGRLLLPDAELVDEIVFNDRRVRLIAIRAIDSLRISPKSNRAETRRNAEIRDTKRGDNDPERNVLSIW